jgi:membrane protein CcdC involved in cytochrome C biogenesis
MNHKIKKYLQNKLDLTENQANLLILGVVTTIFQGIIYNFIDHNSFSSKYFLMTILMSIVYNMFYYKTYVNADVKNYKKKDKKKKEVELEEDENDTEYIEEIKQKYEI